MHLSFVRKGWNGLNGLVDKFDRGLDWLQSDVSLKAAAKVE